MTSDWVGAVSRPGPVAPGSLVGVTRADPSVDPASPEEPPERRRVLRTEVVLVLAVSVGASALYAALSLLRAQLGARPVEN